MNISLSSEAPLAQTHRNDRRLRKTERLVSPLPDGHVTSTAPVLPSLSDPLPSGRRYGPVTTTTITSRHRYQHTSTNRTPRSFDVCAIPLTAPHPSTDNSFHSFTSIICYLISTVWIDFYFKEQHSEDDNTIATNASDSAGLSASLMHRRADVTLNIVRHYPCSSAMASHFPHFSQSYLPSTVNISTRHFSQFKIGSFYRD